MTSQMGLCSWYQRIDMTIDSVLLAVFFLIYAKEVFILRLIDAYNTSDAYIYIITFYYLVITSVI